MPPSHATLLEVDALSYAAPDGRLLAERLSFRVDGGDIVAVTGPNGVGKSTLLDIIRGRSRIDAGEVRLGLPAWRVGYLAQLHDRAFHIPLLLRDVLSFAIGDEPDRQQVERLGLLRAEQLSLGWNSASGGERQKTLLTRVLLQDPELLILDEPMNHLDPAGRGHLRAALDRFVADRRRAVLMVCHEQALAENGWRVSRIVQLSEHR